MTKYAALLRGIGPGNPNMSNQKLRNLFESLGFKKVQSVISSGNILFESDQQDTVRLENMIEEALPKKLGFSSATIIRSQQDLQAVIDRDPFKGFEDTPSSRLNVTFLKIRESSGSSLSIPYRNKGFVVISIFDGCVFTSINLSGTRTPDVMLWLERQFGKEITTRTWRTVNRIMSKLGN